LVKLKKSEIETIKRNCKATLKIEGIEPSRQAENINDLFLNGYIDSDTAIKQILKFWGCK
jgi:hypothetical protein